MRQEWRCTNCGKMLGVIDGIRLHIQFARGPKYIANLPATSTCQVCGTINELLEKKVEIVETIRRSS